MPDKTNSDDSTPKGLHARIRTAASGSGSAPRPPRKAFLSGGADQVIVPQEFETAEKAMGYFGAAFSVIFFIVYVGLNLHFKIGEKVPVPKHPKQTTVKIINLAPYFFAGLGFAAIIALATWKHKRQIAGASLAVTGILVLSISPYIAICFVILGIYLMLRHSRRMKQTAPQRAPHGSRTASSKSGQGTPSKYSKSTKSDTAGPDVSKRYTPPKQRRSSPGDSGRISVGKGGMVRGDLPSKKNADAEESTGIMDRMRKSFGDDTPIDKQ